MSPVGERDIDLPEADKLIIFDSVRTIKTVYQQLKRIRGGKGVFLYYKDTYEERKINAVISNLLERYPWSTKMADTTN
jgi:ERCC4-related helicase